VRQRPDARIVSQVADGVQALSTFKQLQPDLVLLDIGLPELNGIEVARRMPQLYPDSRILFVSQESSDDVVAEALSIATIVICRRSLLCALAQRAQLKWKLQTKPLFDRLR
jgi:DNA-binding NarL/FixJ family response regulator